MESKFKITEVLVAVPEQERSMEFTGTLEQAIKAAKAFRQWSGSDMYITDASTVDSDSSLAIMTNDMVGWIITARGQTMTPSDRFKPGDVVYVLRSRLHSASNAMVCTKAIVNDCNRRFVSLRLPNTPETSVWMQFQLSYLGLPGGSDVYLASELNTVEKLNAKMAELVAQELEMERRAAQEATRKIREQLAHIEVVAAKAIPNFTKLP